MTEIEARNPQTLLSEWYDGFDDQFKTKDWWVGGVDAPGVFKVASADNAHPGYLEMTYKEGASWRMFRDEPQAFYVFGSGTDTTTFRDASDIYLSVEIRLVNAGTAWATIRTQPSLGKGTLNGYRLQVTRAADGSYSVKAGEYSLAGTPVFYDGDKVAFFANGRFLTSINGADILNGSIALGVDPATTADFDNMQLRDASPDTHLG